VRKNKRGESLALRMGGLVLSRGIRVAKVWAWKSKRSCDDALQSWGDKIARCDG